MNKTFSTLKKVILFTLSVFLILAITGYVYLYILPKGPEITEEDKIDTGNDSFVMYAYKESTRKSIRVWTYKPESWKDQDEIVFVMHGGGRNADDYLDAWTTIAEENNLLIVAPEFENKFSNYTTNDYQEGNLFTFFGSSNPESEWAYTVVENIFDHIKSTNNISNEHYDIFGHSAGGQFVHRMIILMPDNRIETAVAANAGFYTLPDENLEYPYGIKNTGISLEKDLKKSFKKKLIVLLGELDNDPSLGTFRTTELAMKQGAHRLERGTNFYQMNQQLTNRHNWTFNWEIDTVRSVGHNYRKMSENSISWIVE
ncbi:hypothetical protein OO013_17100 [Mangrovivirga sp. M17]|uniref:Alpha/beta hydrolase n=1 Tax=Mangrovivirga halotolerans TaxID=2993936 RepID=A0ABT3RVI9_9BACT|nr:hypothetical protein [Mangrovivirga halotolerans]MCX2745602.1 hypothetical protein [Mangrovivirga halotolerans]